MKKQLLTVFITLFCIIPSVFSQTEQGKWLVGAASDLNFSVSSSDGSDENTTSFNIGGQVGYFIVDNLTVGARWGFSNSSRGSLSSNSLSVGPGVRYYVNSTFFLGALFSYNRRSSNNGQSKSSFDFTTLGLEAGYPVWLGKKVAIEPGLFYSRAMGNDVANTNSFGLNIGFNLYL